MTIENIGRLTAADESLNHQIADTFATIVESDLGWTEKIWASMASRDGSLQVEFGLGKYHNRNVMDGFGGVSCGHRQWTVRASRRLSPDLERTCVGPVQYRVIEPLKRVRFILARNTTQSICFDVLFEGELPPFFEKRNRLMSGNRVAMNVIRYHQPGRLSGWVEIDGQRHVIDDHWFGYRDHSWGMRGHGVGAHPTDLEPNSTVTRNMRLLWGVSCMKPAGGAPYELAHFLYSTDNWSYFSGHINSGVASGVRQEEVREMVPEIAFDPRTRQFLGATYHLLLGSGERRAVRVRPAGPSGFYLRTGLYGGWNGARHGSWLGEYHESGECVADISAELPRLGQLRDVPVYVEDGTATGYGIQESVYSGVFPELGLGPESDYSSDF
jgi:hypothetical protein